MLKAVIAYLASGTVFLAFDMVWLTIMGGALYRPLLGDLMLGSFRPLPAVLFYVFYIAGLVALALWPALTSGRIAIALVNGAVLGFVAYGTYDLTNQATLKTWPTSITLADMCWGTVLTATAAALGFLITRQVLKLLAA